MRDAGLVAAEILDAVCELAKPGVSTLDLDRRAAELIGKHGVKSAFLNYDVGFGPYPAVLCTSINHEVVHGIPKRTTVLVDGDVVSIDFGIFRKGFCADTARTLIVGPSAARSPERELVATAEASLFLALAECMEGRRIGDIGASIQKMAEGKGFSVVTKFVGHGIGRAMHEDPQVPNFGRPGEGKRLRTGLVIAVEPMVNAGTPDVEVLDDKWTVVTKDGKHSAHFEHTVAITKQGPWVLTKPDSKPGVP